MIISAVLINFEFNVHKINHCPFSQGNYRGQCVLNTELRNFLDYCILKYNNLATTVSLIIQSYIVHDD